MAPFKASHGGVDPLGLMVVHLVAVIPEIAATDKGTYVTQKGLEVANALETLQLAERLFEDLMTYVTHKQAVFVIIRALKAMVRRWCWWRWWRC